jgi:hypothetical protein
MNDNIPTNSAPKSFIQCNLPIWLLNIAFIYVVTTLYYFITKNINEDPIKKILEPFPKLQEYYEKEKKYTSKNFIFGLGLSLCIIIFIKPFGKFF